MHLRTRVGVVVAAAALLTSALPLQAQARTHTAAAGAKALRVTTDKGAVQGAVRFGVEGFLGIPYAAPPTGNLRWKAPKPAARWSGVKQATEYGSQCPQPVSLDSAAGSTDEDCLFVNVQRPVGTKASAKLPVYVYIHGGGFTTGSGENTEKVVRDTGVVGVSLNYRMGVLGFLSLPSLTRSQGSSGNYGLQDQQAALKWVQRNIARFGGDPRRVTIGGESAGGFSVCAQMESPGSRKLFSQAMIQSGACVSRTQRAAEQNGATVAAALGCSPSSLACLRRQPVTKLLDVGGTQVKTPVSGTPFLPRDANAALDQGRFSRVPMVIGGQRDEGRSFYQDSIGWTRAQYEAWVRTTFGADGAAVLRHYPWPADADRSTPAYLVSAIATDSGLPAAVVDAAKRIVVPGLGGRGQLTLTERFARWTKVYAYDFAHRSGPGWTNVDGFVWGAGHATELNYLFPQHGIDTESELHEFGAAEYQLADEMVQYWGAFVKTGRPSPAWLHQTSWPRYQVAPTGKILSLRAGAEGPTKLVTTAAYRAEHQVGFWESIAARS